MRNEEEKSRSLATLGMTQAGSDERVARLRRRGLQRQERRWRRKVAATKWKDAKRGREKQIPRYARDDIVGMVGLGGGEFDGPVEKLWMGGNHNWCGAERRSIQVLVETEKREEDEEAELPERTGESRA